MTDLTGCAPDVFDGLPDTPDELMRVVRGCVVAGLPLPPGRDDLQVRPASAMIDRILEIHDAPIVERREPNMRFIGCCRHFATLSCALLRYKGIPSRVRAGFAGYFEPDIWVDHWVLEHWLASEQRWVRVDAQWSDRWFAKQYPGESSESVLQRLYLSGTEMWQRCRRGEIDPDRCKMGGENWGIGEVRGSVLYDFAAINQDEMLPWDVWGQMKAAYRSETDVAYDEWLDSVSSVAINGDFDAIRETYAGHPDLRVPALL
jgi:hypothetical protein